MRWDIGLAIERLVVKSRVACSPITSNCGASAPAERDPSSGESSRKRTGATSRTAQTSVANAAEIRGLSPGVDRVVEHDRVVLLNVWYIARGEQR